MKISKNILSCLFLFITVAVFAGDGLTIYVTRHAQRGSRTEWKEEDKSKYTIGEMIEGMYVNPGEDSITPLGETQCDALQTFLRKKGFKGKTIYSCASFRTIQTAVQTAQGLGKDVKVKPDPLLQSWGKGKQPRKGITCESLEKRFPGAIIHVDYPESWLVPKETDRDLEERMQKFLDTLIQNEKTGDVLIVGHSSTLPTLLCLINCHNEMEMQIPSDGNHIINCCLYIFKLNDKGKLVSAEYYNYLPENLRTLNLSPNKPVPVSSFQFYLQPAE